MQESNSYYRIHLYIDRRFMTKEMLEPGFFPPYFDCDKYNQEIGDLIFIRAKDKNVICEIKCFDPVELDLIDVLDKEIGTSWLFCKEKVKKYIDEYRGIHNE